MKLVVAVVKPFVLEDVRDALSEVGVGGMTVTEARGHGRERGDVEVSRGTEYQVDFVPRLRVDVLVPDEEADVVVKAILEAARTASVGDGKVWVSEVEFVHRIRTGEEGAGAI